MSQSIPETMRALVLDGRGWEHLSVREVPTPRPGPDQMLARVDAATICTSLIKLIDQGPDHAYLYGWDLEQFPLVLGDEGAVTLVEVGDNLKGSYKPGQRFVVQPAVDAAPVNHRERYHNEARGVEKVAVGYTLGGHLAEYLLITEEILTAKCLLPIKKNDLPAAHASLGEPISCCISAQDHHVHLVQDDPTGPRRVVKGLKPGGVTLIVGAGAMGRMHVDVALSYGLKKLIVSDFIDSRLERVAELFGKRATDVGTELLAVNPGEAGLDELVATVTADHGCDDVIVAVGSGKAIEVSQHYVGRGGVFNLFGGLRKGQDVIGLDTSVVHYKEINVTGSSGGSPWDVARTLELMVEGQLTAGAHIAAVGDLEHAPHFLEQTRDQALDGKAVVYPQRRTDSVKSVNGWGAEDERAWLEGGD